MKLIFSLLALVILGLAGYTLFQLSSFEPKMPAPLVFDEVADPTMMASTPATMQEIPLTPQQQEQSKKSVEIITDAVTKFKSLEEQAPSTIKPTLSVLNAAMASVRLSVNLLSPTVGQNGKRSIVPLVLDLSSQQSTESLKADNLNCELNGGKISSVLLGDPKNNTLACASNDFALNLDQLFIGGMGDDVINDSFGNRIVNAGGGNDIITLGRGRSIVVLEEGWGQDTLTLDCTGSKIEKSEIPDNSVIPWTAPFSNFVVMSPRISQTDLVWDGMTLKRKGSSDSLTVNDKCFTLVTQN